MTELWADLRSLWVLWLMLLFVGIVAWVYWPSRRRRAQMQDHANIPFREDKPISGTSSRGGPQEKGD